VNLQEFPTIKEIEEIVEIDTAFPLEMIGLPEYPW
jgi:hypothetical protein